MESNSHNRKPEILIRVFIFLILLLPAACIQIDTPPSIEITVLDQFSNPVDQAAVALYSNLEQWGMGENPVQTWKLTNSEGKVIFVNLIEQNYYILAEKAELTNLKNEISTQVPLIANTRRQLIVHVD